MVAHRPTTGWRCRWRPGEGAQTPSFPPAPLHKPQSSPVPQAAQPERRRGQCKSCVTAVTPCPRWGCSWHPPGHHSGTACKELAGGERANLNEKKKRLWVRCQHSPCLLYSLLGFCFPLGSFMFPRPINSRFSTGQEVCSWAAPLPAGFCVRVAQLLRRSPGLCPAPFRPAVAPSPGSVEDSGQELAFQEEKREG